MVDQNNNDDQQTEVGSAPTWVEGTSITQIEEGTTKVTPQVMGLKVTNEAQAKFQVNVDGQSLTMTTNKARAWVTPTAQAGVSIEKQES